MLPLIGLEDHDIDNEGYLINAEGKRVKATNGEPLPISEIGYIGYAEEGVDLVPDSLPAIVEYLSDLELYHETWEDPR